MIDCSYCNDGTARWVVQETPEGTDYTALEAFLPEELEVALDGGGRVEIKECDECNGTGELFVDPETGKIDVTEGIFAYEGGRLTDRDTVILFARLIETSLCWKLQGSYGRMGQSYMEAGMISTEGVIDWDAVNEVIA